MEVYFQKVNIVEVIWVLDRLMKIMKDIEHSQMAPHCRKELYFPFRMEVSRKIVSF